MLKNNGQGRVCKNNDDNGRCLVVLLALKCNNEISLVSFYTEGIELSISTYILRRGKPVTLYTLHTLLFIPIANSSNIP